MKHHHSILPCEPGQILIEAAISKGRMWVVVLDGDTFFHFRKVFQNKVIHVKIIPLSTIFNKKYEEKKRQLNEFFKRVFLFYY